MFSGQIPGQKSILPMPFAVSMGARQRRPCRRAQTPSEPPSRQGGNSDRRFAITDCSEFDLLGLNGAEGGTNPPVRTEEKEGIELDGDKNLILRTEIFVSRRLGPYGNGKDSLPKITLRSELNLLSPSR